ncbi:pilus assembly protein [Agrobacterium salinitolerans]|uniref:Pilus assembly protein n=1 Tax=Agrobacterium salinitolerans TaxID=1183413 RepID=A0A9X3KTL4_9HYPH|nr:MULTISPECIES: TadE/TadG family type IV pilus assembly protein [Agrobacterium]MCZ7853823.1 pilus assembly protein [Agrobacterium salinitolerans]MCZ7894835.1 pilus assembly protein [Agrobacterium salinitolerans]MCZ7940754.1 pilus assembly protein [Agrobacterium salinitolerans]TRA82858.1 pilus assembly protein [Agrobacterium salinitolerans]
MSSPVENRWCRLIEDARGIAAIEFALVAPLFALILAGSLDLGLLLFSRFQLEAAVSDSASYAMVHTDQVDSTNGDDLAAKMATIIAGGIASSETHAEIVVNNGAKADYDGTKIKLSGAASQSNSCYCPTGGAWTLNWGGVRSCGTSCPGGTIGGKYVVITVKQAYAPLFTSYGMVKDGFLYASAVVQTK